MARSVTTTPFVGREAEVAALGEAVRRAASGRPGLVVVAADAGVGKSRLVAHVGELATASGARVVTAHCVDLGDVGLPYLPFAEALGELHSAGGVVDDVVEARPALGLLLSPGSGEGRSGWWEDGGSRLQLFDGIAAVLAASGRAGAPLVLVVEDLHWADASSRDVLRFLVSRMRTEHLLVVATLRTDDLHRRHPLRPMLAELARHPLVQRIDLAPFTPDELREFTTAVAGAPLAEPLVRRVLERSEGNAYYAEELLEAGADAALPGSLVDVLRVRLEQLDPPVQDLARVASVAGRRVAEPLLRAVAERAGVPAPELVEPALREAVARQVLREEDGRIAFRHALLAEAVYSDLLPGERTALHRAYRQTLVAEPTLGSAAELAHHAFRSRDLPTALTALRAAAQDAARVLAPAEELRHLETVLELWEAVPDAAERLGQDRVAVLRAAAAAASRSGQDERAVALAREAVAAADGDPGRGAVLRSELARYLQALDRVGEGFAEATRALAAFPGGTPTAEHAWALAIHARLALGLDDDAAAERSARVAVEEARAVGEPGAEADALASLAVLVVGDPDRAVELLGRARDRAEEAGDLVTELRCRFALTSTQYYAGRLAEAADLAAAGVHRARVSGLAWNAYGVQLRLFDELVRYVRGDLSPPAPGEEAAAPTGAALLAAVRLYAAVARGDQDAVDRGRALQPEWDRDGQVALIAGGCTVDALTWAGDLDAAVALALELIDHLGAVWDDYFLGGIWLAALAIAALADGAEADRLVRADPTERVRLGGRLLERAVTTAQRGRPRGGRLGPEGTAWLARAHAEHARLVGDPDPAVWATTVEAFGYGYRYEEARSRRRWAEALLTAGDRDAAQRLAAQVERDAQDLGAPPLVTAVRDLARRGRLELPGVRAPVEGVLTAREAEVLELVARGLSNRQIGERLFISGKTVSVHVSNLLAKLGASGRAEAVAIAHRRGLLDLVPQDR